MLQVVHLDVAKVDRNIARVVVVIHICVQVYVPNVSSRFPDVCLQVFHLDVTYVFTHMKCFRVFFASVSYACFECFSYFVCILQVFHLDVSKVDRMLQPVFQMHISCVSSVFRRMLQVLHLDVSK
jgi:hypothetical protein